MIKRLLPAVVAIAAAVLISSLLVPSSAEAARKKGRSYHGGGSGTSLSCLTPAARALFGQIEARFGKMQVISTCRPGARIAGTGKISKHASGQAIDFNAGGRKGAVVQWLMANHKSGGTMTYSGMSHIHVDIGYHFVALGSGGRRYASRSRSGRTYASSTRSRSFATHSRSSLGMGTSGGIQLLER
jgi:hypothetical protein